MSQSSTPRLPGGEVFALVNKAGSNFYAWLMTSAPPPEIHPDCKIRVTDHTKMPTAPNQGFEALDNAYNCMPRYNRLWVPAKAANFKFIHYNCIKEPNRAWLTRKGRYTNLVFIAAILLYWKWEKQTGEIITVNHAPSETGKHLWF